MLEFWVNAFLLLKMLEESWSPVQAKHTCIVAITKWPYRCLMESFEHVLDAVVGGINFLLCTRSAVTTP